MSKPRVALLFSGQPRCVDGLAYDSFKTCLLNRYDVDVYAHFWGDIDSGKSSGTVANNIERFKQLYNPKAIRVDLSLRAHDYPIQFIQRASRNLVTPYTVLNLPPSDGGSLLRNCISMYESMRRVYALYQASGDSHDWVIRVRSDCVWLRCPDLNKLDPSFIYTPHWHGIDQAVLVNIAIIAPSSLAPAVFSIRDTVERLPGVSDEWFVFNHLAQRGCIPSVRTLPKTILYPTLTRDGVATDRPEPNLVSEVVSPPYSMYKWNSRMWTPTTT